MIWDLISDLMGGLWPKIAAIGVILATVLAAAWKIGRNAVKLDRAKQKEKDREEADKIRDRVERDLPDRLREYDGRGFRDQG